jgi:site-specific DNA recombinase
MKKRAVLYARVSSDDRGRDGRNLSGQLEMCRKYAMDQGWEVVAELAEDDRGASGASFELPKLSQVLQMAEAGDIDVLAVRELDRLSRNLAKQLIVEEELNRHDVEVEYVLEDYPDTPEGRLNKHIKATIAEYEREKITERMSRGRRQKARAGNVLVSNRPPYGYRTAEVDDKTVLVIVEQEAQIVRQIFNWYVMGDPEHGTMFMNDIVRKLGEMGIPTRADQRPDQLTKKRGYGQWNRRTVHGMLTNQTYCGTWHYGKRRRNGEKWKCNDSGTYVAVSVPPIVSVELWEAAQVRLAENRIKRRPKRHHYLLGGRLTCGECGLKMTGKPGGTYLYYRCPSKTDKLLYARPCSSPSFRVEHVDAAVWGWIVSFLTDSEALTSGLWSHHQEMEKENEPIRERLGIVDDLLASNQAQLEKLLDLYLAGDFSKELLTDRKARLEKTISALEKERAGLVSHLEKHLLTVEQIHTIQEFAKKVGENLEAMGDDLKMKRRLVEELDVNATLAVEDGQKVIYARCWLGEEVFLTTCSFQGIVRPLWQRSKALALKAI